jgi:hypothetical protein
MVPRMSGRVIGCDAALAIDEETIRLELSLPIDMVDSAGVVASSLVMHVGQNVIWFDTSDPVSAFEALEGRVPVISETPVAIGSESAAAAEPPPAPLVGRWRRRRS